MAQDSVNVDRWKYIGGSDIPAIMNISPFKRRWDLLREKAQLQEDQFTGSVYTEYGNTMEPKIRNFINANLGHCFLEGRHYDEERGFRIHTDGEDEVTETVLEIKTTSQIENDLSGYKHYLVQLLFYMMTLNYSNGILAVYARPDDMSEKFDEERLQLFSVFIGDHNQLCSDIMREVDRFQVDVARLRENPFLDEQDFMPKDIVSVSDQILALEDTLKRMNAIEAETKALKKQLKTLMIENRVKTWVTPSGVRLTLVEDQPAKMETVEELDLEALKRDLPELFRSYYYGGYMREIQKKKAGREGYVKITLPREA